MPFSISYNADLAICEIVVTGVYNDPLAEQIRSAAQEIILKHNCIRLIIDCRAAQLQTSTLSLLASPDEIKEILSAMEIPSFRLKRAFVVSRDIDDYSFIETVSVNRGLQVRVFQDMKEAVSWLDPEENNP